MARKIIKIDCGLSYLPTCVCGWRGPACGDQLCAQRASDEHRRAAHPAVYRDTMKKRRKRAGAAV